MIKKLFILMFSLTISVNLFAELKISTIELNKGIQYAIDSSVNIRKEPSLKSEKIGKVNFGDRIEVLEKTEIYFESEGIYDCFYKVNCSSGTGYMFGGYISDNADVLIYEGNELIYFDKVYNYEIKIPKRISENSFYKYEAQSAFVRMHYKEYSEESFSYLPKDNKGYYIYVDFVDESPSLEELTEASKILKNEKQDSMNFTFSKAKFFAINKSKSINIQKEILYQKISDLKILKNQFTNTTFISYKMKEVSEPHYVEGIELVTLQNGKFEIKRRCADYARDEIYSAKNTFIMPDDKNGEKNTIRIIGKYYQGNEVTEEYDVKIIWNGNDFVEKK